MPEQKDPRYKNDQYLISPELIKWAYRIILDREPESDDVIIDKATRLKNNRELLQDFLFSKEFEKRNLYHNEVLSKRSLLKKLPGFIRNLFQSDSIPVSEEAYTSILLADKPEMKIEELKLEKDLNILFEHIQDTWERLGETEPYWSVLSEEKYKKSYMQDLEEFYNTGLTDISRIFQTLDRNTIDYSNYKSCLEYGCGLGRVTRWLSEKFDTVYGYDISKSHLDSANTYLSKKNINNIILRHLTKPEEIIDLPKVDFAYSTIVLQHNPPPIISIIIRQIIKSLNPGGAAIFQVPTYQVGYNFTLKDYLEREANMNVIEMHVLSQKSIFEIIRQENGEIIEVFEDGLTASLEQVSNTFLVRKNSNH